jgi:hypothetical protein
MKQGNWSEDPTQLYPNARRASRLPEESFEQDGGRTTLEPPSAMEALVYASMVAPENGAKRAQLPLPPSLKQVLSGTPRAATPRIPHLAAPRPLRIVTPPSERRLTLTPLPVVNPATILDQAEVPVEALPPLQPISRSGAHPKTPRPAPRHIAIARYRFITLVALAGFGLGMALLTAARAVL